MPKEMYTHNNQYSDSKNKWQLLKKSGRYYVIIAFLIALAAEVTLILNAKPKVEQQKPVVLTNTITNTKTLTKEVVRTILSASIHPIMGVTQRPSILDYKPDTLKIIIHFGMLNNSQSFNIRDKAFLFSLTNNRLVYAMSTKRAISENSISSQQIGYNITFPFAINNDADKVDTALLYFKLTYSNSPKKGKDTTIRELFYFTNRPFPKNKDDLSEINPVGEDDYLKFKIQIKSERYW